MELTQRKFVALLILLLSLHFSNGRKKRKDGSGLKGKPDEEAARKMLDQIELEASAFCNIAREAGWKYETNMTKENQMRFRAVKSKFGQKLYAIQKRIAEQMPNWKKLEDAGLRREFKYYAFSDNIGMTAEESQNMSKLKASMEAGYARATVCNYTNPTQCNLHLDPDVTHVMAKSTNYSELEYYFNAWHDAVSSAISAETFREYIKYYNLAAKGEGYNNSIEMWLAYYDENTPGWSSPGFLVDLIRIWEEMRPMYRIFIAYTRMKLRADSPYKDYIKKCGAIPFHITGNMWGQNMAALDKWAKPYPNVSSLDITPHMRAKNYTVKKIIEVADEFFQSLGLPKLTETFYNKSQFTRPQGRQVQCHATANDFCKGKGSEDFRVQMCLDVTMKDLITVHHELGHIQYYMHYTNLHRPFRTAANPGFHEAIGDSLALSVVTPKHLQCVLDMPLSLDIDCLSARFGGKKKRQPVTASDMNSLYFNALDKIALIPFTGAVAHWRSEVYDGKITMKDYNKRWWELRSSYQELGLSTPRPNDKFDPAAKYHIPSNVEYLRYYFSRVVQFSFYEAMCKAAGEYQPKNSKSKPLYQCDITGSKEAGKLLSNMLKLGSSKPWPELLEQMTGSRKLTGASLLHYFEPLVDFMKDELKATGEMDCLKDTPDINYPQQYRNPEGVLKPREEVTILPTLPTTLKPKRKHRKKSPKPDSNLKSDSKLRHKKKSRKPKSDLKSNSKSQNRKKPVADSESEAESRFRKKIRKNKKSKSKHQKHKKSYSDSESKSESESDSRSEEKRRSEKKHGSRSKQLKSSKTEDIKSRISHYQTMGANEA